MSWCVRHTRALCSLQDESVMLDKQHRDEQAFHTGLSVLFGAFFFVSGLFFKPFFLSLFCPCAETRQHSIPALCCNQISAEQLECFIFSCSSTFQLLMENAIIRHRRLRKQADENVKDTGHPGIGTSGLELLKPGDDVFSQHPRSNCNAFSRRIVRSGAQISRI